MNVLMQGEIPFQQGEDSMIVSPKLDSLFFGMVISNGIVAPLLSTKLVFLHEGGLGRFLKEEFECSLKEDLGFFFKFLCFISMPKSILRKKIKLIYPNLSSRINTNLD